MNSRTSFLICVCSSAGLWLRRVPTGSRRAERRALAVAADHPALARVNDLAAQRAHPLDRGAEVGDREIREREAIAGAGATLVQPEHDPLVLGPPTPAPPQLGGSPPRDRQGRVGAHPPATSW